MAVTLKEYNNEVARLVHETYSPDDIFAILSDEIDNPGTQAYTDYMAVRAAAKTAAAEWFGYYPITATPAAGAVAAAGGTKVITVAATGDYTVTCPAGCTSDITNGTPSDTTVTIAVAENTGIARTFEIVFTSGSMSATAPVSQDAVPEYIPNAIAAKVVSGVLENWIDPGMEDAPIFGVEADPYTPTGETDETILPQLVMYLGTNYGSAVILENGGARYYLYYRVF